LIHTQQADPRLSDASLPTAIPDGPGPAGIN
jgi:hypothetical protein